MSKKNGKSLYLVALALFLGGVGYLVFSGFSQNSVYFLNVSEALAMPSDKLQSIRMFGTVAPEGIARLDDGPGVRFLLEDKDNRGQTVRVMYRGAVPDTFKEGVEVIVEGGMPQGGPAGEFRAKTLMTKCPSKYEKENRKG
ncbi:cytochrome c maturation protein CcmE [Nitratidesulfovibrio sp. HK-II]|uniref:cytochrome c maturation protein CcmE n=1 Tax=Nitratidesulfovibrio sp. HK-II TaxID=2009266 RepID=UPI000E2E4ECE|nr:cytochrome c maturation protein CcmE [Nitratidesulfovibrio sp. HK-II]GBO96447.1 cytochrome c-type biogenesis protein CcmE [Nitratidesulfovibrio sp. HK-II]